ncbi:MAG: hypothetical protein ING19_20780 [Azospirillum sp.]|nr:hypothetical protein [Azospirillum sp.]MCA3268487.1 hypothetical protein [Azospirillum sp.]
MARPAFKPTKAQRGEVARAKATGMSDDAIALGLGISRGTLLKHFALELDAGAAKRQIKVRAALMAQAESGNVAACKAVIAMMETASAEAAFRKQVDAPTKSEPMGKKEAARIAADGAENGTEWSGLLPN